MKDISKSEVYEQEVKKLKEIFQDLDPPQRKLAEGLIEETAYLKSELIEMREVLKETGMIKIHQSDKSKQKALPIANEYRRTANIYALNIKSLNSILGKNVPEEDDAFDQWIKEKKTTDE